MCRLMDLAFIFQAMKRELEWSVHLSLPAVLIQLKSERCYNLARLLYDHTMGLANMQVKYAVCENIDGLSSPVFVKVTKFSLQKLLSKWRPARSGPFRPSSSYPKLKWDAVVIWFG